MARKPKDTAVDGPTKEENSIRAPSASSRTQLPDGDRVPSFSSTMPPRLNAPKSPELSRAMAATQPEKADRGSPKKKNKKNHRPSGVDDGNDAEEHAPPSMEKEEAIAAVSLERKRKKEKKRQSELQSEDEDMVVETAPERKKKEKKGYSKVQPVEEMSLQEPTQEEAVVEPLSERKQKKKRHSELPPVEEPTQEGAVIEPTTERKRKKKKRHSEAQLDGETLIHDMVVFQSLFQTVQDETAVVETSPEKKQKKKKRQSTLEVQPAKELADPEETVAETLPEPKKKKKRESRVEEAQLVKETTAPEPAVNRAVQAEEAIVETSPERKKKKKKRHSTVPEVQLPQDSVVEAFRKEEAIIEASSERKSRKKRHSKLLEVQQSEETVNLEKEADRYCVQDEESVVELSPKSERKKKKRHSVVAVVQELEATAHPEEAVSGAFAQTVPAEETIVESSPERERKKKNKKKRLTESDVQPVEEIAAAEDHPTSPAAVKSSQKKRSRTEEPDDDLATSTKKSRKHTSPSEADELELQGVNGPSLLASHLNGDTSAVASLWEQRHERLSQDRQQTVPATQSTQGGTYPWQVAEQETEQAHGGANGLSCRREESIETESEAENHELPVSGLPRVLDGRMDVDNVPHMPPFETDDIESVASDEEGRALGNRAPSIESDSDRVPNSPSPAPADVELHDGAGDIADVEMHDVGSHSDDERQPDEEEVSATPYPEPEISSPTPSTRSHPPSRQETETPPQESEDEDRQVSPPTTEDSQSNLHHDDGQPDEEVAQPPSPEPVVTARAKGKRSHRKSTQEPEILQDSEDDDGKDNTPAAVSSPASKSHKTPKSRMSTARKPKAPFYAQENDAEGEKYAKADTAKLHPELLDSEVAGSSRTRRKKNSRSKDDAEPQPKLEAPPKGRDKGPLSIVHQEAVKTCIEDFRQREALTKDELIDLIQGTPKMWKKGDRYARMWDELWACAEEACPRRSRQFLISWSRLNFHRFVGRGKWTKEQDDELRELIKKYPTKHGAQWAKIGAIINRHPDDCREHWRNKLVVEETRKLDYWTEEEEQRLYEAVQKAVMKIKEDRSFSEISDKGVSKLVNWFQIALDGMGGTRDRLQCLKKWAQLGAQGLIEEDIAAVMLPGESWRIADIKKDLKRITPDDKYKMVKAIAESRVLIDSRIPWKTIVQDILENRFQLKALTLSWVRLRAPVPGEKKMKTRAVAKYLCQMYETKGAFVETAVGEDDDTTTPPEDQDSTPGGQINGIPLTKQKLYRKPRVKAKPGEPGATASIPKKPKSAKRSSPSAEASMSTSTARKTILSEEYVHETDSDEVPESDQEDRPAPFREPSIDLSLDAPRTPARRPQRTYGGRNKSASKRAAVVDSDSEEEAPASEASPARTIRSKVKSTVVVDSDEEEDVQPSRKELPTPSKKKMAVKRKRSEDQEAGPSLSVLSEGASSKKRKARAATVGGWEAPVGVPLRAVSVISSNMDDMEDIQATLAS